MLITIMVTTMIITVVTIIMLMLINSGRAKNFIKEIRHIKQRTHKKYNIYYLRIKNNFNFIYTM